MTVQTAPFKINQVGIISIGGLEVEVMLQDIKERWGHTRFLVSPVSGSGQVWVEQFKKLVP